jgi:anti-sigma B factor antagonist
MLSPCRRIDPRRSRHAESTEKETFVEAHVTPRIVDGVPILDVAGELDLYTSPKLKAAIDALLAGGRIRFVVNLLETRFLDSTALSILSTALQEARTAGGNLGLIYNQSQISRMFAITGLAEIFPVFSTEGEALATVKSWESGHPAG